MDEKQNNDFKQVRGRKFPFVGLSLLTLSVLLTCSVATLIYFSAVKGQTCQTAGQTDSVDIEADVKIETEDGEQKDEKITYDQTSRIAYYYGEEGAFTADDLSKGIRLLKKLDNGVCYLTPIGGKNQSDHRWESSLKRMDGQVVQVNSTVSANYRVLPGEIEDLSIIPPRAHGECTNGYRWMVPVNTESGEGGRHKRDLCYYNCEYIGTSYVYDAETGILYVINQYECEYTYETPGNTPCPDEYPGDK